MFKVPSYNSNARLSRLFSITMKLNANIKIVSKNIVLIPYRSHHVPTYHDWMKSEELQKLTASEPLTLEEEYEMQKSWLEDEDKCTFIILDRHKFEHSGNELASMVGDTNIFIVDKESSTGEIEIMIAEESARGKKLGWEAVTLMLTYGIIHIKLKTYEAKISLENEISIRMFRKLGFVEKSKSDIFQEITLTKDVTKEWLDWLESNFLSEIKEY